MRSRPSFRFAMPRHLAARRRSHDCVKRLANRTLPSPPRQPAYAACFASSRRQPCRQRLAPPTPAHSPRATQQGRRQTNASRSSSAERTPCTWGGARRWSPRRGARTCASPARGGRPVLLTSSNTSAPNDFAAVAIQCQAEFRRRRRRSRCRRNAEQILC